MSSFSFKYSFIKRLFASLALLYLLIFFFLAVFQTTVFERVYTRRTINSTIEEIQEVLPISSSEDIDDIVLEFSLETQTTTSILPLRELTLQDNILSLQIINVESDGQIYPVYVPENKQGFYRRFETVEASLLYVEQIDKYVPLELTIGDKIVIQSRNGNLNPLFAEYFPNVDSSDAIEIEGTIQSSFILSSETETTAVNPIVSAEILNILSESYTDATKVTDNAYYYYSLDENQEQQNLVFVVNTMVEGTPHLFISVFPVANITNVVSAVRGIYFYSFVLIISILVFAAVIYGQRFSKPLITINEATKKLSNLDFEESVITIENQDEFGQLAVNINVLSANLQTTLNQLSKQNEQLSKRIDMETKNEQRRIDFIRGMSHELKTPLSVIQAASEGLENDIFETEELKKEQLQVIQKEVQKTNHMIKDMMAVYKLDNSNYKEQFKEFNFSRLIEDVLKRMELLVRNNYLSIDTDLLDATIYSDPDKIELVISNLLSNAIKYTPSNHSIRIYIEEDTSEVTFHIRNYGVSLEQEQVDQLFDPFYRVNKERSRHDGSTGLGLYIVDQTLSQLDSECFVESGSNYVHFHFSLKK